MNTDTKTSFRDLAKVGGLLVAAGAALVGVTNLVLPAPGFKPFVVAWDKNETDPAAVTELWGTTNLRDWYFVVRVAGTNVAVLTNNKPCEFFKIRNATPYVTGPDHAPVTNWLYSDWARR